VDRRYAVGRLLRAGAWAAAADDLRAVMASTLAPPAASVLLRRAEVMVALSNPGEDDEGPTLDALAKDLAGAPDWAEVGALLAQAHLRILSGTAPVDVVREVLDLLEQQGAWR
jgi:hypothetical protein